MNRPSIRVFGGISSKRKSIVLVQSLALVALLFYAVSTLGFQIQTKYAAPDRQIAVALRARGKPCSAGAGGNGRPAAYLLRP